MRKYFLALMLIASASILPAQTPNKAPDIIGIPLGMKQAEAKTQLSAVFQAPYYMYHEATSNSDGQVVVFAYDRVAAGHDQFGAGYAKDGSIYFLVHRLEYNPPPEEQPRTANPTGGSKQIQLRLPFGKKKAPEASPAKPAGEVGTDLNLRPTLDTFLDTLIQKYGPPSERVDNLHSYTWYLDANYHVLKSSQVPYICKPEPQIPLIVTNSNGPGWIPGAGPLYGRSFPGRPEKAYADCGIGIWVKVTTRDAEFKQEFVTGYSISIFDQNAAYQDIIARQPKILRGPDPAHRPKL